MNRNINKNILYVAISLTVAVLFSMSASFYQIIRLKTNPPKELQELAVHINSKTKTDIDDNKLSGTVPEILGQLTGLQKLNLYVNIF